MTASSRDPYAPDPIYHLKNFENLLYDAVHMLYLAHDIDSESDEHGYEATLTRGSIVSSLLLFECAANCCIDVLRLKGAYVSDIDKLPFLSKFEFFLSRIAPKAVFDRGCKEVQAVAELKALRDGYVHPKVRRASWEPIGNGSYTVAFQVTSQLGISLDPSQWGRTAAISAIRAANDFFNLYLLGWCAFNTNTVCGILLETETATIPATALISIDGVGGLTRAASQWGIDFRFIGKQP